MLADANGVANNRYYYFSSRDYATRNPDVLRIAIEEINRIDTWVSQNKDAAAAELARPEDAVVIIVNDDIEQSIAFIKEKFRAEFV